MSIPDDIVAFADYFASVWSMLSEGVYTEDGLGFEVHYFDSFDNDDSRFLFLRVSHQQSAAHIKRSNLKVFEDCENDFIYSLVLWGYIKAKQMISDIDADKIMFEQCKDSCKDMDDIYSGWLEILSRSKTPNNAKRLRQMRQITGI